MGVLFAAFLRVPLTSVFMVLEVSGNYSIVLPVILANTVAYLIARSLQPVPIFELFTHQDGLYLPSMEEAREESELRFEDALQPPTVPVVQGDDSLADVQKALQQHQESLAGSAILVQCASDGWYAAKAGELQAIFASAENLPAEAASRRLQDFLGRERTPLLFPDQALSLALPYFQRWPLLPVSNRAVRGTLEGVVSLDAVLERYQRPRT